jgi:hypothetical protein
LALGATVDSGGGANNTMDAIIDEPIDTIVVTDTTSNMGKLGEFLRSDKREHGYCFAHLLHLVAGIAFDRKSHIVCIQLLLSNPTSLYSTVIPAKNVPQVKEVMQKLRSVIGYFDRSTQANTKLRNFQEKSDIEEYAKTKTKEAYSRCDHKMVVSGQPIGQSSVLSS